MLGPDARVEGRVIIEAGARLERCVVRGPAVIGARAIVRDAFIGPYTAVAADCLVENAEVEHSILLEAQPVESCGGRMQDSLLGRDVTIGRSNGQPRAWRFLVGDHSEIGIL